ncbi:MAG: restriction endonuclease subunit S [bacterium]|nr:restriction endonuclease subunit S [bacterium]
MAYPTNPSSRTQGVHYGARKLGEVCEIKKGKKPELFGVQTKTRLPYLEAKFMRGTKESKFAEKSDKNSVPVNKGDLIIICDGSKSGDVFSGFEGVLSSTMGRIDFDKKQIEKVHLELFLKTKFDLFNSSKKGAAIPHLDFNIFNNLEIPLPPIAEQKKIVARLEGLLTKIKEAKRLRAEAQKAAQNLLPAKLHRIFTQPPIPHKQHPNKLEFVSISGRQKPASVKNYGEAQWEEKELGEVVSIEAKKNTKLLPYVGMEDVESGTGKFIGSKEKRAVRSTTSYFATDHVLYGKLRPYLNKFLVPDFEGHCTTEFLPLRPNTRFLTREWLAFWLRHDGTVNNIMATTTGSRMPRANMNLVKKLKIPLPTVAEQKRIVARLDSLSEKIKNLREYQNQTQFDFTALEQSILHKAFGGKV